MAWGDSDARGAIDFFPSCAGIDRPRAQWITCLTEIRRLVEDAPL